MTRRSRPHRAIVKLTVTRTTNDSTAPYCESVATLLLTSSSFSAT